jgi:hypothetical protein
MYKLNKRLLKEIENWFLDHFRDSNTRQTIVQSALLNCAVVHNIIWEGSATDFTHHLIQKLSKHGKCKDKQSHDSDAFMSQIKKDCAAQSFRVRFILPHYKSNIEELAIIILLLYMRNETGVDHAEKIGGFIARIIIEICEQLFSVIVKIFLIILGLGVIGITIAAKQDTISESFAKVLESIRATHPEILGLDDNEYVTDENVSRVIYDMLEQQLVFKLDCPNNLEHEDWYNFQTRLELLNFEGLAVPERNDLKNYRSVFASYLDGSFRNETECGVVEGELLLALRPVLVDYQINAEKVQNDTHHLPLTNTIYDYLEILDAQFHVQLGLDSPRLEQSSIEAKMFTEYFLIWMVLFVDADRTPTALRAQTTLLSMNPEDVQESDLYTQFVDLHEELSLLSQSITKNDDRNIARYSSTSAIMVSQLSINAITEDEALYLGGDRLVSIIGAMNSVAQGGNSSDIEQLRQFIDMFREVDPNGN